MSSHREAPALTRLSSFSHLSVLAALPIPGSVFSHEQTASPDIAGEDQHTNLNITDFYVFQKPGDPRKTILIMNVNPMPPRLSDSFDSNAIYDFKIDTNGDMLADVAFRITFSQFNNGQQQAVWRRVTGHTAAGKGNGGEVILQHAPVSFGPDAQVSTMGEYTFFAGWRSDPFFFDLMGFCNNLKFTGSDYFLDKDVFGIVLEVPNSALGGQSVALWSRVLFPHDGDLLQIARLGLPMLNIIFNAGEDKHDFNEAEPSQHRPRFLNKFVASLVSLGHTKEQAQTIAQQFLPDVLRYNSADTKGFFNGRKLTDDVTDDMLKLITQGKITTDKVGPHTDYLAAFPYLGQPHGGAK
jgi:hypothetical protein